MSGCQNRPEIKCILSKIGFLDHLDDSPKKSVKDGQEGQLIIEYVLLLTVVTLLASQIIGLMIGQGATADEQGLVIRKWSSVINAIAADLIDN